MEIKDTTETTDSTSITDSADATAAGAAGLKNSADTIEYLQSTLNIPRENIEAVLNMLAEGSTIPFIARYRKENTGNMDEETILTIQQAYAYQENLKERKEAVIRLIEEKGLLNPEVKARVEAATKLAEVEDIYRPYKEKKKTKASAALEAGLEPLAREIMTFPRRGSWDALLAPYVEKTGMSAAEVKQGAGYIIAQNFSDDPKNRSRMKEWLVNKAKITTSLKKDVEDQQYTQYHEFTSNVKDIKPHQVLAINRAEKEKIISVSLDFSTDYAEYLLFQEVGNGFVSEMVEDSIMDGWKRLLLPSLTREIRRELSEVAEKNAIDTFQVNLEHLLMTRPLGACRVLGYDPGYAHGCKLACLDEQGNVLTTEVIKPFLNSSKISEKAKAASSAVLKDLIRRHNIQYIAIGNGTASRESEALVAEVVRDFPDVQYALVSEAGASVYSASDLAREEFPDMAIETRSAVSIGRRIQDPLSELVKIDPKSIGIGEYQHDVNQKELAAALDFITEKVVNNVGVNINTASPAILKHISGLKKPQINKLVAARTKKPITSRQEIAELPGISDKVYEQCIGFIRVPESSNPLDQTGIHPESYSVTLKILDLLGLDLKDMRSKDFNKVLTGASVEDLVQQTGSDMYTVQDIIHELTHPGLDPRSSLDGPILKSDILKAEDLKPGMALEGTVRNVTSFGAFIDIGLHNDGLVHISKLSDHFVSDPKTIVAVGDIVTCYVLDVDVERERVSLSLVPEGTKVKRPSESRNRKRNRGSNRKRQTAQ